MSYHLRAISVSVGRKLSRGYNTTDVHISLNAELEEGADAYAVKRELADACVEMIHEEFDRMGEQAWPKLRGFRQEEMRLTPPPPRRPTRVHD